MSLSARKVGLLAKAETTAGVDSVPTAAANAILLSGEPTLTPIEAGTTSLDRIYPYFGNSPTLISSLSSRIQFGVEIAGSGTPLGTIPGYSDLLKACGFAEVVTATTRVEYNPVSGGSPTLSIYAFMDSIRHRITEAIGTFGISLQSGGVPRFNFDFLGRYETPTDASLVNPDYSKFRMPVALTSTSSTATLGGVAICLASMEYTHGNEMVLLDRIGCQSIGITDRKPTVNLVLEAVPVATRNWWNDIRNSTAMPLVVTVGTVSGNIVEISIPRFQPGSGGYGNTQGTLDTTLSGVALPNVGNDEIKITVK